MKHFKDLFSILCLLFITSAFVACDDDNDEYATDDETILSVPQDDLIFTYEGEAKTINVTASENTFVALGWRWWFAKKNVKRNAPIHSK